MTGVNAILPRCTRFAHTQLAVHVLHTHSLQLGTTHTSYLIVPRYSDLANLVVFVRRRTQFLN